MAASPYWGCSTTISRASSLVSSHGAVESCVECPGLGLAFVLATLAIPGFMTHYCVAFDPREILRPARALRRVLEAGPAYWKAWGIALSALALSFLGLLGLGVGFLFTSVWFWQVAGFSFASVFAQRYRPRHEIANPELRGPRGIRELALTSFLGIRQGPISPSVSSPMTDETAPEKLPYGVCTRRDMSGFLRRRLQCAAATVRALNRQLLFRVSGVPDVHSVRCFWRPPGIGAGHRPSPVRLPRSRR